MMKVSNLTELRVKERRNHMKRFVGTKIIYAEPMTRGEYNIYRGWNIPVDENPEDEGYLVRYSDGYESWSPKKQFEEAYRRCDNMTFGLAIEAMKLGFKVARKGWNGKNQHIELATNISYVNADGEVVNCEHDAIGNKAIAFVGTSGVQMGWLASQADMLAEDWKIVNVIADKYVPCIECEWIGKPADAPNENPGDFMWAPSEENGYDRPCKEFGE